MANNCLDERMKGVINNPLLPKVGELIIDGNNSSEFEIRKISDYGDPNPSTFSVRVLRGTPTWHTGGAAVTDGSFPNTNGRIDLNGGAIAVSSKYSLTNILDFSNGFIDDYKYMDNLHVLTTGRGGSLASLSNRSFYEIFLRTPGNTDVEEGLSGSVSRLIKLTIQNNDVIVNPSEYRILTYLGSFPLLTTISMSNVQTDEDVVDFVHAKRMVGVTTGSVTLSIKAKINGAPSTITGTTSWTASTITCNGQTIDA